MKLTKLTPEMVVADVKATVGYYQSRFGFTLLDKVDNGDNYNWASVKNGDLELMFISRESINDDIPELKTHRVGGSTILFIEMDGISELFQKIKSTEKIITELHSTFYGTTEFVMTDINGYFLMFAQRL